MKNVKLKNLIISSIASFFLLTTQTASAITFTPGDESEQATPQPDQQPQNAQPQAVPAQATQPQAPPSTQAQADLQQQAQQANPWKLPPEVLNVVRTRGEAILAQNPNNSYELQEVGTFLLFSDESDAAFGEQLLQRAIQLNQNNPQLVDKLTQFIQIAGPTGIQTADQLRRFFEVVIKYSPNDANAYAQLAAVYQLGGQGMKRDFSKAKDLYEKALAIDPNNKIALLGLGTILKEGGDGVSPDLEKSFELFTRYQQLRENPQLSAPQAPSPTTQGPLPQQGTTGQPQQ